MFRPPHWVKPNLRCRGLKDFTERCIQLHGPARSVDLYALTQQNAPSVEPGDGGDVKDRRGEEGSNKRKVCVVCV